MQLFALSVHEFAATASYVLIAIHVSAAIYSRIKGEGVWSSMVPILNKEEPNNHPIIRKVADFEEHVFDHFERIFVKKND